MRTKDRRDPQAKTIVVYCVDCKKVMGSELGTSKRVKVSWGLCERCVTRRNGMVGARSPRELGIY